jgi:hypothetical protein
MANNDTKPVPDAVSEEMKKFQGTWKQISFEAWTLYPLNVIFDVIFFLIVPRTRPASEFHST